MVTRGIEMADPREDLAALRRRVIKELVDLDRRLPIGRRRSRREQLVALLARPLGHRRRTWLHRLLGR
jgi:hypothetical protein